MSEQKRGKGSEPAGDRHEFEFRRHRVRIEQPGGARPRLEEGVQEARLFLDDEEIPVEVTEHGVLSHEIAFKEYATIDELAEDIIRQRGTAEIVKGEAPPHDHDEEPRGEPE